jgi:hypothetical protein
MTQAFNLSQFANKVNTSGQADLTTAVTGTLPKGNGGTGLTTSGTSGNVLMSNGTDWVSGTIYATRNRIINGAMTFDQRNAGAATTPSVTGVVYNLDRWAYSNIQASKFTIQQTPSATETGYAVRVGAGFTNYLSTTVASAYTPLTGDLFAISQFIEGSNIADLAWGTSSAKTVTLSFWVNSSLTGTFGGSISNQALDRSYPFTYTISAANTWEQKTITIAGDTTGTWRTDNDIGIRLYLSLGAGATYTGTAGAWAAAGYTNATGATNVIATASATWRVTGVQLEQGSTATPFERRLYNQELANCQRYYEIFTQNANATAFLSGVLVGANNWLNVFYKQTKRVTPTVTAPSGWVNATPGVFPSIDNCSIGGGMAYFYLAGTGTILTLSAEL